MAIRVPCRCSLSTLQYSMLSTRCCLLTDAFAEVVRNIYVVEGITLSSLKRGKNIENQEEVRRRRGGGMEERRERLRGSDYPHDYCCRTFKATSSFEYSSSATTTTTATGIRTQTVRFRPLLLVLVVLFGSPPFSFVEASWEFPISF